MSNLAAQEVCAQDISKWWNGACVARTLSCPAPQTIKQVLAFDQDNECVAPQPVEVNQGTGEVRPQTPDGTLINQNPTASCAELEVPDFGGLGCYSKSSCYVQRPIQAGESPKCVDIPTDPSLL